MTTRIMRTISTGTLVAAGIATIGLAAGTSTIQAGSAAAETTVKINGGRSTKLSCDMDRRKDITIYNRDSAGYYYGDCVQAPSRALGGLPGRAR